MPKRAKPLLKPYTPDTMTSKDTVAKFANALEQLELIDGQLSNTDLMLIREVMATLLLQIPYKEAGGTHNLIGLVWTVAEKTRYLLEFVEPTIVGAYDATIDDDDTAVVCEHTEAAHKSKQSERGTYETARQETVQFILAVVEETWVREL